MKKKREKYINILIYNYNMIKSNLYCKIDNTVKERAMLYITNAKLLKHECNTLGKLVEISLHEYMINHSL